MGVFKLEVLGRLRTLVVNASQNAEREPPCEAVGTVREVEVEKKTCFRFAELRWVFGDSGTSV